MSMLLKKNTSRKNKLSVSPIKSTTPVKPSSSQHKFNNSATHKKINIEEIFANNLAKNRETLSKTLDTYTLLIRSKNPIRCLQHNSNISIYCETEQKLLCANCIFGRVEHKFHRVTPIDHSYQKIQKDVDTMKRLIDREVGAMKHTGQSLMQNLVQQQNDAHECLSDLVKQYEQCHQRLEQSFLISKTKIINKLEVVRRTYETLLLELKLNLQNYDLSNVVKPINRDYFKKEQFLLFQHVVCSAIAGQKKFEQGLYISKKRQVHKASGEQRKKILLVVELINRLNSPQK